MNQRIELFSFLNDNAFHHKGKRVEFVFDFFGINVLSACTEKHIFAATTDIEVAFSIKETQVARVIPTIGINGLGCRFWILVVSQHYVGTTCKDFTNYVCWVGTVNAHFHAGGSLTT